MRHRSFPSNSYLLRNRTINRGLNSNASPRSSSVFFHSDIKCSDRLRDRSCVITGGSSGIGYAIAERFLHEGAGKVVIIGRNKKRLLSAMENLQLSLGDSVPNGNVETAKSGEDSGKSQKEDKELSQNPCETIHFSSRISALAGDVGLSNFWAVASKETALVCLLSINHKTGPRYTPYPTI